MNSDIKAKLRWLALVDPRDISPISIYLLQVVCLQLC